MPAQFRPSLHGDPGRAAVDGQPAALGRLNPALLEGLGAQRAEPVSGGCIHDSYRIEIGGKPYFVKTNAASFFDTFAAEADGLGALSRAGSRAPAVVKLGTIAGSAFLLLEWLDLDANGEFAALGAMLARQHRVVGQAFGWTSNNYIGATVQENAWLESWPQFWRERRIEPQLERARQNGFSLDDVPVERLLGAWAPRPSLLHGDLWAGNAGFTPHGPVLFDPAVYYGDREADIAMTELFGGFPDSFYSAYEREYPLEDGYALRKELYNLYHLLNHLNLFGGGYLAQVKAKLGFLSEAF